LEPYTYTITYRNKKTTTIQASKLGFDLDELREKQGRKKFTYETSDGSTYEILIDTDEILDVVQEPFLR